MYFSTAAWDAMKQMSIKNMWQKIFRENEAEAEYLFCGFSEENIRLAEEKSQRYLDEQADLAVIINGWATREDDCPGSTDEPDYDPAAMKEGQPEPESELPTEYSEE